MVEFQLIQFRLDGKTMLSAARYSCSLLTPCGQTLLLFLLGSFYTSNTRLVREKKGMQISAIIEIHNGQIKHHNAAVFL